MTHAAGDQETAKSFAPSEVNFQISKAISLKNMFKS